MTDLFDKLKNKIDLAGGTDIEKKVKEATSNENWGASGTLKQDIARATLDYEGFRQVMPLLWDRLINSPVKNWRVTFKALCLLEYLMTNGSERVVGEARSKLPTLRSMQEFNYVDEENKDRGEGVRQKSIQIVDLLNDSDRLRELREKSKQNQNKYQGMSNADTSFGSDSIRNSYESNSNDRWDSRDTYSKPEPVSKPVKKVEKKPVKKELPGTPSGSDDESDKPKKKTGKPEDKPKKVTKKIDIKFDTDKGKTGKTQTKSGNDDFDSLVKSKKTGGAAGDDWADFTSGEPTTTTASRTNASSSFTTSFPGDNDIFSTGSVVTPAKQQQQQAPAFDIFDAPQPVVSHATNSPQIHPDFDIVSAVSKPTKKQTNEEFSDFQSGTEKQAPKDALWDSNLVNLGNLNLTDKKSAPPKKATPIQFTPTRQGDPFAGLGAPAPLPGAPVSGVPNPYGMGYGQPPAGVPPNPYGANPYGMGYGQPPAPNPYGANPYGMGYGQPQPPQQPGRNNFPF